jgi:hypothetical protein
MPVRIALALAAVLFAVAPALAADPKKDEKKDEPTAFYTSWSKFKPGTSVTLSGGLTNGKVSEEMTMTLKLVEVKDKDGILVFDIEGSNTHGGKTEKRLAEKVEVKRTEDLIKTTPPFDPKTGKPKDTVEDGTEKLKVGDTEFECKWYKTQKKSPDGAVTESKVWVCDSFPGIFLKETGTFGQSGEFKSNMTATDVTIKK